MRLCIQKRYYVMTLHAEEEMDADELTIYDVESAVLTGRIVERQKDKDTGEWKYRLRGTAAGNDEVELVAKFGVTGKLVIITVYLL
ncbi:DUF4258 domain-containing protein [bacterium]|nr:DUF4258 domain-containing protein [bacterium]MCK4436490.1 DUF4258 domain-containing protein [bacterium]